MSNAPNQFKAGQAHREGVVSSSVMLHREAGFIIVVGWSFKIWLLKFTLIFFLFFFVFGAGEGRSLGGIRNRQPSASQGRWVPVDPWDEGAGCWISSAGFTTAYIVFSLLSKNVVDILDDCKLLEKMIL